MADETSINELEELRIFLEDAIRRADPTIDTAAGSPFDREVITPLLDRIGPEPFDSDALDFIRGRLLSEFPELSVQEGEPIDDYLIKPSRMLLVPFRRQINRVSQNQSFADPALLSDDEADNLAANWFAQRNAGEYAVGLARLYFTAPQSALVTPSNAVYTSGDLKFFPVENQSITADNMLFNTSGSLFYFDVLVRSEAPGSQYKIAKNTLIGIEGVPAAVRVANPDAFETGADEETTEEFLSRVENGLTEKSLVTTRGILARLSDLIASLKTVQVIGFGDPEMDRDVLTAEVSPTHYASFQGTVPASPTEADVLVLSSISDGDPNNNDFIKVGVEVGDLVVRYDDDSGSPSYGGLWESKVIKVIDANKIQLSNGSPFSSGAYGYDLLKDNDTFTLSGVPGGLVRTETPTGVVEVNPGEVHIGGMVDVFVRAGNPQEKAINIDSMRDANPARFGVDLESFGEDDEQFVSITDVIIGGAEVVNVDKNGVAIPGDPDEILITAAESSPPETIVPWHPTDEDVGRYIQIQTYPNASPGDLRGTFEILEIIQEEDNTGTRVVRIKVSLYDEDSGNTVTLATGSYDFRIKEKVSFAGVVRDRDNSRSSIPATILGPGVDIAAAGVGVGDSVVIETGDDSGSYTIRKILDSLDINDSVLLDRDLTKTVAPTGFGDGSGLRYRINDEVDLDLVTPRVTKIPLGDVFTGTDLGTVAGSTTVTVSGGDTNFLLAGVESGDILNIASGDNAGEYTIQSVTGTSLILAAAVQSTASSQNFSVYKKFTGVSRPMVRVKDIELLDSSRQPTGIKVPYGDVVDIRTMGKLSNRARGSIVESLTGVNSSHDIFEDTNPDIDFAAKGVSAGDRLTVFNSTFAGDYEIRGVSASALTFDANTLPPGALPGISYRVGSPSTGIARLYFIEPTSCTVDTGEDGAKLTDPNGQVFRFSETEGRSVFPAEGEDLPRDLRVMHSREAGAEYRTVVELTDTSTPDVFGMGVLEGDLLEVHEQIPFTDSAGDDFTSLGIYGNPAGLITVAGSNKVRVPENSVIDFTQMGTLEGNLLYIDSGPDSGQYTIEEIVDSKSLRLNQVMTASTETIITRDYSAPGSRDAILIPTGSETYLRDDSDAAALGTQVGQYITIFESTRDDLEGSFEITEIDQSNNRVKLDVTTPTITSPTPAFTWLRTAVADNVLHQFRIYQSNPLQLEVKEVTSIEPDAFITGPLAKEGDVSLYSGDLVQLTDSTAPFITNSIVPGDRLEVLSGDNRGVYTIETVASTSQIRIYTNKPFSVAATDVPYRIRGGIHGPSRTLVVGDYEGAAGVIALGERTPYRIIRPGTFRLSSTDMQDSFDGTLYYAELTIESEGAGDNLNLEDSVRLTKSTGIAVDGYTYEVGDPVLSYSPYEQVSLKFDRRFLPVGNTDLAENLTEISGRNYQITYDYSSVAGVVDSILRSEAERAVTANPVGRHFLPSYVFFSMTYKGGSSADLVGSEVESLIDNLTPTAELEVSDLEAVATKRGATYIAHPLTLVSVTHDLNRDLVVERSQDKIGGLEVPYEGSARISAFFSKVGEGLNVVRES